eukprot:TRINITY_DN9246_c0_g5_i1.p1 TRINITY_DN9246_c0_g5~~TRINITY_DN9246_c0_g5_i1.p1  ORF type:complete len:1073 (-),score=197.76 TRINITY_DN9246_c0_g5_i1:187-3405(-)
MALSRGGQSAARCVHECLRPLARRTPAAVLRRGSLRNFRYASAGEDLARIRIAAGAAAGVAAGVLVGRSSYGPAGFASCSGASGSVVIQKPETHRHREYEYFQLPNGLRVIVASDASCDKAAAALCVGVGRLHEPKDMPGLAHFCEHMLFLGTERFPDEAEYKRFVKRYGGHCNAATGDSYTYYAFDVSPDHLAGALDRFSQFFLSPLFTPSATERELNAVDSEHSMRITDDGRRAYATLLMDANPMHPLHWGSGNAQSLRDGPRARGIDPHARVVEFYKKHYTAEDMTLAVVGRDSLPELRQIVEDRFADVPVTGSRALRGDEHGGTEPAILPHDFAGLVLRVPSKDVRSVSFSWQLPHYQVPLWASKPTAYASHIIGHEGENSLLSTLKAKGYATGLYAGGDNFGCFSHFDIHVNLTEDGVKNIEHVGVLVFAFLRLVRATPVQTWVLEEQQSLADVKFRYADDQQPYALVSNICKNLQNYPASEVFSAPVRITQPDVAAVDDVLQRLSVDGVRVELTSKALADRCPETDPWYSGRYARLPLEQEWRETWAKALQPVSPDGVRGEGELEDAEAQASALGMRMPRPNPFVPKDLSLRKHTQITAPPAPHELSQPVPGIVRVFHRQDDRFKQPKNTVGFVIHSPVAVEDAANYLRCQLWCNAVMEELNEFSYDARTAGLSYHLGAFAGGMELTVSGFNDKLPLLLEVVTKKMHDTSTISPATFAIVRDRMERGLKNRAVKQRPCDYASRKARSLKHRPVFSVEEQLEALASISIEDVAAVGGKVLAASRVEALMTGNLHSDEAAEIAAIAARELHTPVLPVLAPPRAEMELPPGRTLWILDGTNDEERNNNVRLELQIPATLHNSIYTSLFVRMVSPRFFEELRTKQQLGYIVQMSSAENDSFVSIVCTVQTEYPPEHVRKCMDAFLEEHFDWLERDLDEAEFDRQRAGLVSNLAEAPKNRGEEFGRYWNEIFQQRYDFGRRERKRLAVETADLASLRAFVRLRVRDAPRLHLEVHSIAPGGANAKAAPADKPAGFAASREPDRVWRGSEEAWRYREEARWVQRSAARASRL